MPHCGLIKVKKELTERLFLIKTISTVNGIIYALKNRPVPAPKPPTPPRTMPQIDLPQTVPTQKENVSPAVPCGQSDQAELGHEPAERNGLARLVTAVHLSQSEWTNIAFVVVTVLGGLFCALYFFNGTEFFHSAAAWHREYLYPRPSATLQQTTIDRFGPAEEQASALTENYRSWSERGGNPFGGNVGLLSPNQSLAATSRGPNIAGSPSPASGSNPISFINQLNLPPPGGDALLQAFNRGAGDVARASSLEGRRTVVVLQAAGSQTRQRVSAAQENATSRAHNTLTNASGQQSIQTAQKRSQGAGAAQNQTAAAVRSTNSNTSRQTVGTLRGMASRPMSGLGSVRAPVSVGGRR